MADPAIASVTASAYTVPTDLPEADGTLAWDATTLVVVRVATDDPRLPVGLGWTYAPAAATAVVDGLLADVVRGRDPRRVEACWEAMVRAVRNAGRPGLVGMAISAVDVALWDLAARLLDRPLPELLGACRDDVPLYGSGGFTTYDDEQTRRQVDGWLEAGLRRVKIKIGESWGSRVERDLARVGLVAAVAADATGAAGPGVELFVDANGGYATKQAIRVGRALDDLGVTWFEEPVTSDDPAGLARVRAAVAADVTAGEYGWALASFVPLVDAVDCLQIDATRCGGYTEWRRVAALAAAHGLEVSGHCAPHLHAPVALATANLRHVEWFHDHVRIERLAFDGLPDLGGLVEGALPPTTGPGHGLVLREADLAAYRVG